MLNPEFLMEFKCECNSTEGLATAVVMLEFRQNLEKAWKTALGSPVAGGAGLRHSRPVPTESLERTSVSPIPGPPKDCLVPRSWNGGGVAFPSSLLSQFSKWSWAHMVRSGRKSPLKPLTSLSQAVPGTNSIFSIFQEHGHQLEKYKAAY